MEQSRGGQVGRSRNSDEVVFWVQEMLPSRKKRGEVARLQAETSAAWLAPWKRAIGRLLVVKKIHRATSDTRGKPQCPKGQHPGWHTQLPPCHCLGATPRKIVSLLPAQTRLTALKMAVMVPAERDLASGLIGATSFVALPSSSRFPAPIPPPSRASQYRQCHNIDSTYSPQDSSAQQIRDGGFLPRLG